MHRPPSAATRLPLLALLTLAVALPGCRTKSSSSSWDVSEDDVWRSAYPKAYADPTINNSIVYAQPSESRTESGTLQVAMPIRWRGNSSMQLEYRFLFFDEAGIPLQDNPAWKTIYARSQVPSYVRSVSLSPDALDWALQLRPSNVAPGSTPRINQGSRSGGNSGPRPR